jgi:putative flavoprotein involved in K+ transport
VLERGEVANSWRLRALGLSAPADSQLAEPAPGLRYEGADPDGYMTSADVVELISPIRRARRAPVRTARTSPRCGAPTTATGSRRATARSSRAPC